MTWWMLDKDDHVMSDGVADEVGLTLEAIAKQRAAKPSLGELLDAFEQALRTGEGRVAPPGLRATEHLAIADVPGIRSNAATAEPELVHDLGACLDRLAAEWQTTWKRPPALIELLHTFSFVLCAAPAEYTRDQPARELRDIEAVSD